ncbi:MULTISPECIES: GNAT family N-acetyltransferase [Pseudoalteromonas]|uniref:GNAT family N-acetyltransferase n=1 Tax=Pseudoalteromonas amylolytica TaxID=1859457 RepID=A0A1S1MU55_9GAMM|nr:MULTISPECIES: GNAT family N-acetyltransferase [Pseudoalteromonas]OHU90223.1 GNAT family N-acetyltransferase [Pseudoalteromonas sp. JW3]OHU92410.1 GNAT family N-acetyltransferase [Pseudoalteromonas amylolytica]
MQTYYLEMLSEQAFTPSPIPAPLTITEVELAQPQFNQFLYALVGKQWQWTDKLSFSTEQWRSHIECNHIRTWVAYVQGAIAGYYELSMQNNGHVEIAYFGLTPDFIGKGYGGALLSHAINTAWSLTTTKRLWVHTCDLDHPSALKNYQSRGFSIYKTEVE